MSKDNSTIAKSHNSRLDYIDALRGVAILMVIAVHVAVSTPNLNPFIYSMLKFGNTGVPLFFIISAITLCMSFEREERYCYRIQRFYIKRFFRIAPLYYFGIIFYYCLHTFRHYLDPSNIDISYLTFKRVLANIFLIHDLSPDELTRDAIVFGGWSIGVETTFYAIFPLFIFISMKSYGKSFLILLVSLIYYLKVYLDVENVYFHENIFSALPVFTVGIFYFQYLRDSQKEFLIKNKFYVVILSIALFASSIYLHMEYGYTFFTILLFAFSFIVLYELFKHFPKLSFPLLVNTGKLSYSIYLFHFVPAWYTPEGIKDYLVSISPVFALLVIIIFTFLSTYFVAKISERVIEQRGILMGRKIIAKRFANVRASQT